MFDEEFQKLSRSEKNLFAESVNNLLYECYITRRSYDKRSRMFKINPDYLFLERNYSLVEDYLDYINVVISKADDDGVIFVASGMEKNHLRTDTVTTLITYALRSYYEGQISKNPSQTDVLMTSGALYSLVKDLNLTTASKHLSNTQISQALRTLDSYNIIARADGTYSDVRYSFFILPTIRYCISNEKLNALYHDLSGENEEETAEDNSVDIFQAEDKTGTEA